MVEFPPNPTRFDPYKNFRFRVKWDGRYIAAVSRVTRRKLGLDEKEIRRMLDPRQATRLSRIQTALDFLGKRLVVSLDNAA